jgi:hypothetical protein
LVCCCSWVRCCGWCRCTFENAISAATAAVQQCAAEQQPHDPHTFDPLPATPVLTIEHQRVPVRPLQQSTMHYTAHVPVWSFEIARDVDEQRAAENMLICKRQRHAPQGQRATVLSTQARRLFQHPSSRSHRAIGGWQRLCPLPPARGRACKRVRFRCHRPMVSIMFARTNCGACETPRRRIRSRWYAVMKDAAGDARN